MPRQPFDVDARVTAWRIIKKEGFTELPVNPLSIMTRHGIRLINYSQFASFCGRSRQEIINDYDEDGFLFPLNIVDGKIQYCIVYNEDKDHERINWTLMHELCHYFLGHVKTGSDVIRRNSKNKNQLDVEADALCARIFCPTVILHMCCVESPEELAKLCGISYPAAYLRWKHLQKARHYSKFLQIPEEREIIEQFGPFICKYLCKKTADKRKK